MDFVKEIFSSGPLTILGYAFAILFLGLAVVFVIWFAKKMIKPKNIQAKIGDKEFGIDFEEKKDENGNIIYPPVEDNANNIKIDQNVFIEIVKDAAEDAFRSAQKRIELKEKVFNKQYKNAWDLLHTFILQLSYGYNIKAQNAKDQSLLKYALESEFNMIMKEDFEMMFKQNHFWKINDSQLEVRVKQVTENVCARMQTIFISANIDDPELLATVFERMKEQLYSNINQILVYAKTESAKYRTELNNEIELNYTRTNDNINRYVSADLPRTEKDKLWEEEN